jgi:hypothetical protein
MQWWRGGRRFDLAARGGLSVALSTICDNLERRVYPTPPGIEPRQRRRTAIRLPTGVSAGRPRVGPLPRDPLRVDMVSATVWR